MGRYTAYEYNAPGRTLRIAPFLGLKAPTGADKVRDAMGQLPPPVQPGSGSWDVLGGAVLTWQTLDFQIDSQVSYTANRAANAVQAGNVWQLDGSFQYRLWPGELGDGVPAFLYGVLEARFVHSASNRSSGNSDPDSGGNTVFITPGLQYVTPQWLVEAGVQIPVSQNMHGTALKNDYLFTTGFRVNF